MTDSILVTVVDGLARVTFNRPASLNAMDFEMGGRWRDIAHALTHPALRRLAERGSEAPPRV